MKMNDDEQVIHDLAEHINTLGSTVKALFDYVKGQDLAIQMLGNFLTIKYEQEFVDYAREFNEELKNTNKDE